MHSKPKTSRAAASTRRARPAARQPRAPRANATPIDRHSGALKHLGGSLSDEWNDRLAVETVEAMPQLACETRDQKMDAALQGLAGLAPRDELEGMMAAQLIAAHAAAMDCYRCAADEESAEERREQRNQAVRLSRAFVALLNALQRYRRPSRPAVRAPQDDVRPDTSARHPEERAQPASKDAKQPSAAPLAPASESAKQSCAAPSVAAAESAKQPHAKEIPPAHGPRLESLRRETDLPDWKRKRHAVPDWGSLSDQELKVIMREGPEGLRWRARLELIERAPEPPPVRAQAAPPPARALPAEQPSPLAAESESAK